MFYSHKSTNLKKEKLLGQFTWVVIMCFIALLLYIQPNAQVLTESIATGGLLVNNQDGVDNLFVNPARLSFSGFHFKLGGVGLTFDANNRDLFNFIGEYKSDFTNWSNLSIEMQDSISNQIKTFENREAMLQVSPVIGMAFRKFAIAAYATSFLDLELLVPDQNEQEDQVELKALQRTEAVVMVGMSNQIHSRLAFGVNARLINHWENSDVDMDWEKAANINNWLKLLWEDKQNFMTGYSIGGGVCLMPTKSLFLEYTANNLLFHLGDDERNINSNIQVTAKLTNNIITRLVSSRAIRLAGSISSDDNLLPVFNFKKAAAGVEIVYPLLKLRAGINENRYSYGANLNLALFNIGYACQIDDEKSRYHSFEVAVEF